MSKLKHPQFYEDWKRIMLSYAKLKYGESLPIEKTEAMLDAFIMKCIKSGNDPQMFLTNNYLQKQAVTTASELYAFIKDNNPIIGGNGVLFHQHDGTNPQIEWIMKIMAQRKEFKNKRDEFKKDTPEWRYYDQLQLNTKIKINSLYGVTGYKRFPFYNIYLAQSVTAMGQNTISTAACGFEAAISDNLPFIEEDDLYRFILTCQNESEDETVLSYLKDDNIRMPSIQETAVRLVTNCYFKVMNATKKTIMDMITMVDPYARKLIYYKNNMITLLRNPVLMEKLAFCVKNIPQLRRPVLLDIENPEVRRTIDELWEYIRIYSIYEYPVYDRIRRTKYIPKKSVLYIDTDSNFLSLYGLVRFVEDEVLNKSIPESAELDFIVVNMFTLFLTRIVDSSFQTMCKWNNIQPNYAKRLAMKNEFYFKRILFVKVKKRYVGLQILQEGKLLNDGEGDPEIKGFDFIKSTTKPTIRKFYETLCLEEILKPREIDVERIFLKIVGLESDMRKSLESGDTQYFKQANIKQTSEYVSPYSIQGIKAVMLWNTLNPSYALQLPTDVDIVPIVLEAGRTKTTSIKPNMDDYASVGKNKDGKEVFIKNGTKNLNAFAEHYPDAYERLSKHILFNENPSIRSMGLNYIAKPKNPNIPIPPWFNEIMDSDKIVNDALSLFNPIMESLGINILKMNGNEAHYTNIVAL